MMSKGKDSLRVIVDAGVGSGGLLMRQAKAWLAPRRVEYCLLDEIHKGIPDVEILDKVLGKNTVLVTKDRVLHNRALRKGFQSLTLDKNGRLTHRALPGIRLPKQEAASTEKELRADYVREPSVLALKLKDGFSEKQFQKYRRRRRRIRSYFGSADNIAKASVTISSRRGRLGDLHGYVVHLAGKSGVKGLKASEGYCRAGDGRVDPCFCVMHALADLYLLELDDASVELFVIPPDSLSIIRSLLNGTGRERRVDSGHALGLLLAGLSDVKVYPCTKGRFHDVAERKLTQLMRSRTNEVVRINFADMVRRICEPLPGITHG
jgi:hypothetical protein